MSVQTLQCISLTNVKLTLVLATSDQATPSQTEGSLATSDQATPSQTEGSLATSDQATPSQTEGSLATSDQATPSQTEGSPAMSDQATPSQSEGSPAMSDQATPSQSEGSDDDDAYHDCPDGTEVDTVEHIFEMSAEPENPGDDTCSEEEQEDQLTELQSGIIMLALLE